MFNRKEYMKQRYINNKEITKERARKWQENNPEKVKEYLKTYYQKHCEEIKEKITQYQKNNSEKIRNREKEYKKIYRTENRKEISEYDRKYRLGRLRVDLKFNLHNKMATAIRYSLKGNKAGCHWESLVGYTLNRLIKHLQKTMPEGYCWQDFIKGKLHIDHIIPKSVFNYDKPEHTDFKRCWALSNLQLLPARENLKKGSKLSRPFQPALQIY